MKNLESSEFSGSEQKRISEEYKSQAIPTDLEDKTMSELRARGLFKGQYRSFYRYLKPAIAFLLVACLFTAGIFIGKNSMRPAVSSNHDQYLILLHNPAGFLDDGSHAGEYGKWFGMLKDVQAQGEELKEKGWTVKLREGIPAVAQYDKMEASGYFIIHASSETEALKIAATCPHLKYNGEIEVRPVQTHN